MVLGRHCRRSRGGACPGPAPAQPSPAPSPPSPAPPRPQQLRLAWAALMGMRAVSCPSSPVAAVSPVLDCGYCLIGDVKITRFICKNVGFSVGRFCIMPKKSWPPPSFRVSAHSASWEKASASNAVPPMRDLLEYPWGWKGSGQNCIAAVP